MKKFLIGALIFFRIGLQGAIYDCFTFFNEIELLKMRLEELDEVVDYFVIVEGTKSFTGNNKPLYFKENASEFEKYRHKIIHLVIDTFPPGTGNEDKDHWNREIYSRNYMLNALKNCQEDDVIFISDLDEIPRNTSVKEISAYLNHMIPKKKQAMRRGGSIRNAFVCELGMRWFSLSMNRENPNVWMGGSKAVPYWFLKFHTPWEVKIYHHKHKNTRKFSGAGWHFNGMGGDQRVLEKWKNTAPISDVKGFLNQLSSDEELLNKTVQSHRDTYTHTVEIDDSYPRYFLENLEHFRSLGWIWND